MRYIVLLFLSLTVSTAMAGDFLTATVDMQQLFKAYPGTAPAQKKFDALTRQRKQDLASSQEAIKDLQDQLKGRKLSAGLKKAKQDELQQELQDYDQQKNDIQNELTNSETEMTQNLVDQIKAVVAREAKAQGVELVVDSSDAISTKSGLDLTEDVLQKFATLKPAASTDDE